jgi:hypothetical protein
MHRFSPHPGGAGRISIASVCVCVCLCLCVCLCVWVWVALVATRAEAAGWRELLPGVEYDAIAHPSLRGPDPRLHLVRIDPARAELRALLSSQLDGRPRTARRWCEDFDLAVAINLGMYQTDLVSNVGYARNGDHVNSGRWASKYKSALAFSPIRDGIPRAALFDVESKEDRTPLDEYRTVIQNLRLIGAPGRNVWSRQDERWSEAAIAMDREGHILFVFSRFAQPMWNFNEMLLSMPLGIIRAMHVEGGREASLSIHVPGFDLDLAGTRFETALIEDDARPAQWRVPNVVGVVMPSGNAKPATPAPGGARSSTQDGALGASDAASDSSPARRLTQDGVLGQATQQAHPRR